MIDRIDLPRLQKALWWRYHIRPDLCCTQQADNTTPRTQTIAWDCKDRRDAARIVPPDVWTRKRKGRYGSITLTDEWGNSWYVNERPDGTCHVVAHTTIEGEWKHTKKAEQQAARTAARICKALLRRVAT